MRGGKTSAMELELRQEAVYRAALPRSGGKTSAMELELRPDGFP